MAKAAEQPPGDALFDAPLGEFLKERDALAKALAAKGDTAAAKAVRALRKPSPVAWAINQAARQSPVSVERVLEASAALLGASDAALSGRSADLRAAAAERDQAVSALARLALEKLGKSTP